MSLHELCVLSVDVSVKQLLCYCPCCQVSKLLPVCFAEKILRVYCKNSASLRDAKFCFQSWCHENDFLTEVTLYSVGWQWQALPCYKQCDENINKKAAVKPAYPVRALGSHYTFDLLVVLMNLSVSLYIYRIETEQLHEMKMWNTEKFVFLCYCRDLKTGTSTN